MIYQYFNTSIPWYIKVLLMFTPIQYRETSPVFKFQKVHRIGVKELFGVVYIISDNN